MATFALLIKNRAPLSFFSNTDIGVILNRSVLLIGSAMLQMLMIFADLAKISSWSTVSFHRPFCPSPTVSSLDHIVKSLVLIRAEVFKILVQAALLFAAQKLMAVTLPVCIVTVYLIQKVYLQTSRQLRLLELESQSAVYSSFLESVSHTSPRSQLFYHLTVY